MSVTKCNVEGHEFLVVKALSETPCLIFFALIFLKRYYSIECTQCIPYWYKIISKATGFAKRSVIGELQSSIISWRVKCTVKNAGDKKRNISERFTQP